MTPATSDLVKRLRNQLPALGISENGIPLPITEQAAACIEAQSAEIARLRGCLTNIKEIYEIRADIFTNDADLAGSLYDRARAALETKG